MEVDSLELRRVLSLGAPHIGGGVCGPTANAFTSMSLDPPLILVCVDRASNTRACIEARRTLMGGAAGVPLVFHRGIYTTPAG